MEEHYSVEFFNSFVEHLQEACQNYLSYNQFVEVSGYISVEIDNMKKERYVLSELLQSSGNVVSESYCTKAFNTSRSGRIIPSFYNPEGTAGGNKENQNEKRRERKPSQQSRELTTNDTDLYPPLPQSHSSGVHLPAGTFSEKPRVHEKRVSLPQRQQDVEFHPQYISASRTDYAEPPASTSVDSASSYLEEEEVIDLDTEEEEEEEETDPPESMETAGGEDTFESTVSSPGSSVSQPRKSPLSPGTLVTVRNSVKKFCKFHFDRQGRNIDLLSTSPEKLNQLLLEYFQGAQKITGGALTATTLKSVQKHLDMYLKEKGYPYAIGKSEQFQSSRDYIKKKLSEAEKSVSQKHTPVNNDDIEVLFQKFQLGVHTPDSLINTLWFLNSKYFGIRRPAEHFNLKWKDIRLGMNQQGQEFLERPIHGAFSLKMFAKPDTPNRCFVNFYKQYRALRPKMMLDEESPFYLKIQKNSEIWFLPEQATYCSFTYMWRKILAAACLPSDKRIF